MSYLVLARKWRPQSFAELIGQEHIATTLKNAIKEDRTGHAYLFAGPRGVGKTTTARIFAKALNCEKGPGPSPCQRCPSCKEITGGFSLDVIEIDGASNRGIDEVRSLRENVKFASVQGKFKVYIIDEVHMLTEPAFNALLKTLEEPPPHVKFIFATTRPHKVIPTITSRCQRFDFRRIARKDIIAKLQAIARDEKLKIDDDSLHLIARRAQGSMRDAESILDQLISFSGKKIAPGDVNEVLGLFDEKIIGLAVRHIIEHDAKGALDLVGEIVFGGKDVLQFTSSLLERFRNLAVIKVAKSEGREDSNKTVRDLVELPEEEISQLIDEAKSFSQGELFYIFQLLSQAENVLKRSERQRLTLEMLMIKLAHREKLEPLRDILEKVTELERKTSLPEEGNPSPERNLPPVREAPKSLAPPSSNPGIPLEDVEKKWPEIIRGLEDKKMSAGVCLRTARPIEIRGEKIIVAFSPSNLFQKETLEQPRNQELLEEVIGRIFGKRCGVSFAISEKLTAPPPGEEMEAAEPEGETEVIMEEGTSAPLPKEGAEEKPHSIVDSALRIFKGKIKKE